jgi:hypothetical protein
MPVSADVRTIQINLLNCKKYCPAKNNVHHTLWMTLLTTARMRVNRLWNVFCYTILRVLLRNTKLIQAGLS